jgi:hypothetical protein
MREHPMSTHPSRQAHAFVHTFSFWFWAEASLRTIYSERTIEGRLVRFYGPVRMGPANFHPTPSVQPELVQSIKGARPARERFVAPTPVAYPGIPDAVGQHGIVVVLTPEFDHELDPFPANALRVDLLEPDEHPNNLELVTRLLEWIRVLTRQWWIGQPPTLISERITFPINPTGEPLQSAYGNSGPVMMYGDEEALTVKHWTRAMDHLADGCEPPAADVLLLDARFHASAGLLRRAILDAAVACEEALVSEAARVWSRSAPEVEFRPGRVFRGTDLTTRLDEDLKRLSGISLKEQNPDLFERISLLWRTRHACAHTNRATVPAEGGPRALDVDGAKLLVRAAEEGVAFLRGL